MIRVVAYSLLTVMLIVALILPITALSISAVNIGGTLVIAVPSEPTSIVFNSALYAGLVSAQIFDTLLRFDSNLNLVPGLAEAYYVNVTCGCYVFRLRTNATWHDGRPVTVDDVKFTFENLVPKYASFGDPYFVNTTVTIINSTTVVIKPGLFAPSAQLPLFADVANTPILPKHILENQDLLKSPFLTNPIGSGPYKLGSWVKGSYIELVRNDKYWESSKPYLSKIVIRIVPDPSAVVAGLKKGEINYVFIGVPYEAVKDLMGDQRLNVILHKRPPYIQALQFNLNDTILSNPLVRKAIAYAINRTDIALKATLGYAPVVNYVIDPEMVPPPSDLIHYERNVTLAMQLLDQAGYPVKSDGTRFKLELLTRNLPEPQIIAQVLKEQLSEVGISLDIKVVDLPTFLQLQSSYKYQLALIGYWISPIWAYQLFHSKYIGKGAFSNPFYLNDTKVDEMLDKWLHETDPEKQVRYMQQLNIYVNREVVEIPLYRLIWINVIDRNFAGTDLPLGKWLVWDPIINTYYLPIQKPETTVTTPTVTVTAPAGYGVPETTFVIVVVVVIGAITVLALRRIRVKK